MDHITGVKMQKRASQKVIIIMSWFIIKVVLRNFTHIE